MLQGRNKQLAGCRLSTRLLAAIAWVACLAVIPGCSARSAEPMDGVASAERMTLFVSTTGSDDGSCSDRAPCLTLDRAYSLAQPGDVIEIDAGTYPTQELAFDSSKPDGPPVILRPSREAEVIVDGDLEVYAANVELERLRITDNWYARATARNVTFREVDAAKFYVSSARDIRVLGGRIGPSVDAVAQIKAEEGSTVPSRSVVIDNVTFEDFTRSSPEKHMECLHVMAVDGLVIRNSVFRRCTVFDISLKEHGDTEAMRNITIEGNDFGAPIDGTTAINVSTSGSPCVNVLIRGNTFAAGINVTCSGENIRIERNELPSMNAHACANSGDAVWDRNLYLSGVPCGPNDVVQGGG